MTDRILDSESQSPDYEADPDVRIERRLDARLSHAVRADEHRGQ